MFEPGDVISYLDMCNVEAANLQRDMNFHLRGDTSVILMSLRQGAPYQDKVEDNGLTLVYEGHDAPKTGDTLNPKTRRSTDVLSKRCFNTKWIILSGGFKV